MSIGTVDVDSGGEAGGLGEGASVGGSGAASSAGAPSPIDLTNDSLLRVPGSKDPISYKDFAAGHVSKADFDKLQKQIGSFRKAEELIADAKRIDQQRLAQRQQQSQRQQPPGAPVDPYASIRGTPFVSGDAAVGLAEQFAKQMQEGNIAPMQQWILAANKLIADQQTQLKSLDGRMKPFETERSSDAQNTQINALATNALKSAGVDLSNESLRDVAEPLMEFANNFYFAWEPAPGQSREAFDAEYGDRFADSFNTLSKAVRAVDRAQASAARVAKIPKRGGGATPTGEGKQRFLSARERARLWHGARAAEAT